MIYRCPICGNWRKDRTIIDEWSTVIAPPAPELAAICIDPCTSAFLILDMENSICNNYRCIASISKINELLAKAREHGMLVVYSLTHTGNVADIALQLRPSQHDFVVKSNVDKFYRTDLENILHEHCIKTVIITGYAANGAVLHTSTSAAFRGFDVVIPVDGMSASNPYAEQYTAWHMLNSPGTRNRATLTKKDWITFC
ncbi:cysteine hydrolase [Paenibacillus segetis]|uniref:Isochorismatase n=1 Tax=Paenibacillus segetis TaxID=1325360 RepID=A0ABQ1YC71_9BACL|nr:cysteine hydrolase [Paenibacillus segetis]GGH20745.1 isochorismatase [Paenibacillus segetis]